MSRVNEEEEQLLPESSANVELLAIELANHYPMVSVEDTERRLRNNPRPGRKFCPTMDQLERRMRHRV